MSIESKEKEFEGPTEYLNKCVVIDYCVECGAITTQFEQENYGECLSCGGAESCGSMLAVIIEAPLTPERLKMEVKKQSILGTV